MARNCFDPVNTELRPGVNLIEASAGTGKTYAIAMLLLRFVVEKAMRIEALLVVTFTKAATEELKQRIRAGLQAARQALKGETVGIDPNILLWIASLKIAPGEALQLIELALLDIDRAGIFTIHGFCQRVLKEHALESGQLFDSELTGDVGLIQQSCADDFWREQVYTRTASQVALLTAQYQTPDALLASIGNSFISPAAVYPAVENLDRQLQRFDKLVQAAQALVDDIAEVLSSHFAEQTFKPSFTNNFAEHCQWFSSWLNGETSVPPTLDVMSMLTQDGIKNALNGNKFKTNKTQHSDERKAQYLESLQIDTKPFDALSKEFDNITLSFRRALVEYLKERLDQRLQRLNVMSFDNLISRLSDALQGDTGELLTEQLQQRYHVALIDEFQDTDQSQWHIFSTLFSDTSQSLYLIGDPKQAIYKFRGADIFSYFEAQQQAQFQYTLNNNWRSHPALVDAVNMLFANRPQPFLFTQLTYQKVSAALSAQQGVLLHQSRTLEPMVLWQLEESDSRSGFWTAGMAAEQIKIAVVKEILQLLNDDYALARGDSDIINNLKPRDIAILVRTNAQAREYQALLSEVGVPSVLNSTESVYTSQQAFDLYTVLQAVARPGDIELLKQALTLGWFNLDGQQLYRTINDAVALDAWLLRFQDYYQLWQAKGLMAMMRKLLFAENVPPNLAQGKGAERQLTNLHHILELLQQAAVDEQLGINKTVEWLRRAITVSSQSEAQQLRLESDAQAVTIITMHRAKGLEYPVVFCPCLWQRSNRLNSENELIKCHEQGRMIFDLGSGDFARRRDLAIQEELAEDLRVFYVAVTRAKYRCYLAWADVRSEQQANQSAMAYLLFNQVTDDGQGLDFGQQQERLRNLCKQSPQAFVYEPLQTGQNIVDHYQAQVKQQSLKLKERRRQLTTSWQMSSYTALSALSLQDTPELPLDKAREQQTAQRPDVDPAELPRGAHTGNVIHDLLEHTPFHQLAEAADISTSRDQACLRYGLKLQQPALLDQLLRRIVCTPLSSKDKTFCLANLTDQQCLKEMPFYLSMQKMDASGINRILEESPAFQSLSARQMQGYLTGFIDLVCTYQGRYYVIDYKSNALPDYRQETLTHAMREHNYGLQYWIYTLVLHRYLKIRLPGYRYQSHFGGVCYLFVRGMQPDQPMSGVYQDLPALERLEALAELFGTRS